MVIAPHLWVAMVIAPRLQVAMVIAPCLRCQHLSASVRSFIHVLYTCTL